VSVLLTRPREDSERVAGILEQRGYDILIDPVLEIEQLPVQPIDAGPYQAVVLTSRHAVPALAAVSPARPVFCVGDATAAKAGMFGGDQLTVGPGDGAGLAQVIIDRLDPRAGAILHLAGSDVRAEPGDRLQAHGFRVERITTYRARPSKALQPDTVQALRNRRIGQVLLFSPRTASLFLALAGGLDLGGVQALCLSANVAVAIDAERFGRVLVATRPDEMALLDLLEAPGDR
jgi:uroporphyrinogen-III synthase